MEGRGVVSGRLFGFEYCGDIQEFPLDLDHGARFGELADI